ncbi:MAG: alpha/beta hydrolase [Novosphingobium sp.]|nr:alpha/beta hydrolase [Novosphingobium sp.]MBO9601445.1 alpha/beta hydrolase [Novosphingobium sp.]
MSRTDRSRSQSRHAPQVAELFDALKMRAALVGETQPNGVHGPALKHMFGELQFVTSALRRARPVTEIEPAQAPRVVMLLPGFGTHPARLKRMATHLEAAGHTVKRWGQGFNFGPTPENFELLTKRVLALHRRYGEKIVLVGWSLGGIFAREVAKCQPEAVAKVVTMGSPFSGSPKANNVWRIYHLITGHSVENPPVVGNISEKPPVPTVALWSACDGIVSPRSSCGRAGERDKAVALRCGHLGFAYSDEAIDAVLRELETV